MIRSSVRSVATVAVLSVSLVVPGAADALAQRGGGGGGRASGGGGAGPRVSGGGVPGGSGGGRVGGAVPGGPGRPVGPGAAVPRPGGPGGPNGQAVVVRGGYGYGYGYGYPYRSYYYPGYGCCWGGGWGFSIGFGWGYGYPYPAYYGGYPYAYGYPYPYAAYAPYYGQPVAAGSAQAGGYVEATEERRTPPPDQIQRPSASFGMISVRVQPVEAEVVIDGETWKSPVDSRLVIQLAPGRHSVTVRKEGFDTYSEDVLIRVGATMTLNVSLLRGKER